MITPGGKVIFTGGFYIILIRFSAWPCKRYKFFLWYAKSYLPLLAGLNKKELEKVIYFTSYLVVNPGQTPLRKLQILDENRFLKELTEAGFDVTDHE